MDALVKETAQQGLPGHSKTLAQRRDQAIVLHRRGHIEHAIEFYKAHLREHAQDACIWSNLGACLRSQKKNAAALACYRRALSIDPDSLAARSNLGNVLKDLHRHDEAAALQFEVVNAQPQDTQSIINLASVLREQRRFEEALGHLRQCAQSDPENAVVTWEIAQNLLYLGRYGEGFKAYEARWNTGDLVMPEYSCPVWRGEPIAGKRIVLHAEQGYGDTILAARYIKMVKARGAHVILQCKTELHRLFQGIGVDQLRKPGDSIEDIDFHCPLMSLLSIFTIDTKAIPAPVSFQLGHGVRKKFAHMASTPTTFLKLGIVWSGSVTFKNNAARSVSAERFLSLAELDHVQLFSFQKGPRLAELYDYGGDAIIENIGQHCDDFAETAAAIEHMDAIIMTDSSLAHLAGSMGKPVINLLNYVPYWIYSLDVNDTPWYPSHYLLRQEKPGDWDTVFDNAKLIIEQMVAEKI